MAFSLLPREDEYFDMFAQMAGKSFDEEMVQCWIKLMLQTS